MAFVALLVGVQILVEKNMPFKWLSMLKNIQGRRKTRARASRSSPDMLPTSEDKMEMDREIVSTNDILEILPEKASRIPHAKRMGQC